MDAHRSEGFSAVGQVQLFAGIVAAAVLLALVVTVAVVVDDPGSNVALLGGGVCAWGLFMARDLIRRHA